MSTSNSIPFLDLVTPHVELEQELTEVFQKTLRSAGFIGGAMVQDFERGFAVFCETQYSIAVNSGTDALRFALIAAGVKQGDVVVTAPNTFIATTEAISQAGALPEFVDIDEQTYNIDPEKLREHLETKCSVDTVGNLISKRSGRRVTAIVPVHLYGQCADMDAILELADCYGLIVIEDACQAHGAEYFSRKYNRWMKAGSMGHAAAFSFYPGKNLGACGEAGAVATNSEGLAKTVKMLRDHGQAKKYYHDIEGYNGRLDALQAGLLSVKLKHLAEWNAKRRDAAFRYQELFQQSGVEVVLPYEPSNSKAVYHLYVVQVADRDRVQAELAQRNIGTGIHYPIPLHLQKAYASMGLGRGSFPVAESAAERILSLPMFPNLSSTAQERIVEVVNRVVRIGVPAATA
ncbi:MAG: DegT/DnrJ/EryC1/StrS family aminotransferase [Terriglobales bacterium]